MPHGEAVAQHAFHHLARQGIGLELGQQRLDPELAGSSQQRHQQHQPENGTPECLPATAGNQEDEQVSGTAEADPADQREQLPGHHPGKLAVAQTRKENRRHHVADCPHPAHPQGNRHEIEGFGQSAQGGSLVADVDDLVFADPAGGLNLGDVARVLADQRARHRRAKRKLALLDIGLVLTDDLVGHPVT